MNLKLGDKVKCIQGIGVSLIKGNIYNVIKHKEKLAIAKGAIPIWILPDDNTKYYFKIYNDFIINTEQDYYAWLAKRSE